MREARATGNKRVLTAALGSVAMHEHEDGHTRKALSTLRQAYALAQETGERTELPEMLSRMASVLADAGRHADAGRLLAKATEMQQETGTSDPYWSEDRDAETLAAVKANLDEAAFERAWSEGLALSEDDALQHSRFAE